MRTISDIQKDIDNLNKRMDEVYIELVEAVDQDLENNEDYIKLECPDCDGLGIIKEDNRKIVCPTCNKKGWVWGKIYIE